MDAEAQLQKLLSGYVQQHLTVDHITETTQAAVEILQEACFDAPYTDVRSLGSSYDPFINLFSDLRIRDQGEYEETWKTTSETAAHIRRALDLPKKGRRAESVWQKDDPLYVPAWPSEFQPALTRQAIKETPRPTRKRSPQGLDEIAKAVKPIALPMLDVEEEPLPKEDALIFPPLKIDRAASELVKSFIRSTRNTQPRPILPELGSETLKHAHLLTTRPMSPPLFSFRRPQRSSAENAQVQSMKQLKAFTGGPVDMPVVDLAAEHMQVVDGWSTLPEPLSRSPTPPLTNGPSSEVDELQSPPRLRRGFALLSPDVKVGFPPSDMDVVEIPRVHRVRHEIKSDAPKPSLADTLLPLLVYDSSKEPTTGFRTTDSDDAASQASHRALPSAAGAAASLELPESLLTAGLDPLSIITNEHLDDNVLMDVPDLPEPNESGSTGRAEAATLTLKKMLFKRDAPTDQFTILKKVPLKALSMELSWRPVKLGNDLPSPVAISGALTVDEPQAVEDLIARAAASTSRGGASNAFVEPDSHAPPLEDEGANMTLLTREERLRIKRRCRDEVPDSPDDRRLMKRMKKSPSQSSDQLFAAPHDDPDSLPMSDLPPQIAVTDEDLDGFQLYQSYPGSQVPCYMNEAQSQFTALSFGSDFAGASQPFASASASASYYRNAGVEDISDFSSPLLDPTNPVHSDVDILMEDQPVTPRSDIQTYSQNVFGQELQHKEYPDLDLSQFNLPEGSAAPVDALTNWPSSVNHFLLLKGRQLVHAPALPASSAPTSDPLPRFEDLSGPMPYLPDEILRIKPLLLPSASSDFASTPSGHCYLASLEFVQKRAVVSALADIWSVELIERDWLESSNSVHVLLDPDSCVIFHQIASLPTTYKDLVATVERLSQSFAAVAVVFECYVARTSLGTGPYAFSPPVIKAAQITRKALMLGQEGGMDTIPRDVTIELAFAHDPAEAAAFVRLLGNAAQSRAPQMWDDRAWLRADAEYEDEASVAGLPGMNAFAAVVMLSRVSSWEDILEMGAGERQQHFGPFVGARRMAIFNADLEVRISQLMEEFPDSSPPFH